MNARVNGDNMDHSTLRCLAEGLAVLESAVLDWGLLLEGNFTVNIHDEAGKSFSVPIHWDDLVSGYVVDTLQNLNETKKS